MVPNTMLKINLSEVRGQQEQPFLEEEVEPCLCRLPWKFESTGELGRWTLELGDEEMGRPWESVTLIPQSGEFSHNLINRLATSKNASSTPAWENWEVADRSFCNIIKSFRSMTGYENIFKSVSDHSYCASPLWRAPYICMSCQWLSMNKTRCSWKRQKVKILEKKPLQILVKASLQITFLPTQLLQGSLLTILQLTHRTVPGYSVTSIHVQKINKKHINVETNKTTPFRRSTKGTFWYTQRSYW